MDEDYKTPPYTEAQMKVGKMLAERIEKIMEGKSEEEGNKAVNDYFDDIIKIEIPKI